MNRSPKRRRGATSLELLAVVAIILTLVGALMLHSFWGALDFTKSVIEGPGEPSVNAYQEQLENGMNQPPIAN